MRSQSSNSLSTLVFLVPLLGVPLMAIFGVPQFVPVIASSVSEESAPSPMTRRPRDVGESASATSFVSEDSHHRNLPRDDERLHDLFRPEERSHRDRRPVRGEASQRETKFVETSLNAKTWSAQTSATGESAETTQTRNDLFGTAASSVSRSEPRSHADAATARPRGGEFAARTNSARLAVDAERSDEGLTWREAVRRLNELGIQEFRLEPGQQAGEFYFACEFTPDRDARIMRRFEAEASEPLLAVEAVLQQIDEWLRRR